MTPGGTRRGLFRAAFGRWMGRLVEGTERRLVSRRYVRPPGAAPELLFLSACTRCTACADACPPHAILPVGPDGGLAAGTPQIDAAVQPCIACPDMPCAVTCPTDALVVPQDRWAGYRLAQLALHPERCITFQGLACGVCAGACPVGDAALALDESGRPVIRHEGCVGCGLCVRACVTSPSSFDLTLAEA